MIHAQAKLLQHLSDQSTVFVFPSEVAASRNMERILSRSGVTVIGGARFISWDRFKSRAFSFPAGKRPADDHVRSFFLTALLEENARTPFFRSLIPERYAGASMASHASLLRLLPSLRRSVELAAGKRNVLSADRRHDLLLLFNRYREFLDAAGFEEPNDVPPVFKADGKRYLIFYPELITDFDTVSGILKETSAVELFSVHREKPPGKRALVVFPAFKDEIRSLMNTLHRHLADGVPVHEIVITAAGLPLLSPLLRTEAALYDIRLVINEAKSLLDYPGVFFLRQIADLVGSDWNYSELANLLSNRSIPWNGGLPIAALLRFGLTYNCLRDYHERGRRVDVWDYQFRRLAGAKDRLPFDLDALSSFYRSLRGAIGEIAAAPSFDRLKPSVTRLAGMFFEAGAFGEWERKYLQYAYRVLDDLTATLALVQGALARGTKPASAFSFWLSVLARTPYVPPGGKEGIAVYPYRVSAGLMPAYHFIINADEAGTRVTEKPLPFFSIDEEAALSLRERDASDDFLSLYLSSGENVRMSCSRQGYAGVQRAPFFFSGEGAVVENGDTCESGEPDAYLWEEAYWKKPSGKTPNLLFTVQKTGLREAALTAARSDTDDFTVSPITDDGLRSRVGDALATEKDLLTVSATDLESFTACPFRFLLEKFARLTPQNETFSQEDMRYFGTFIHQVFEEFFRLRGAEHGVFRAGEINRYREEMANALKKTTARWYRREALPIPPVWHPLEEQALEGFFAFLSEAAKTFGTFTVPGVEKTFSLADTENRLVLAGKIDLIGETDAGLLLVDYKTNTLPRKGDILSQTGETCSFQIPFYLMLVRENGGSVSSASYYSFRKESFRHVFAAGGLKSLFGDAEMSAAVLNTRARIRVMAERIRGGDFTIDRATGDACARCDLRPVCRNKYLLKI